MRFLCKRCGAESPTGVGYAATVEGPLPAPAADCPNRHESPGNLHGFVFTVRTFVNSRTGAESKIPDEHPAYRRPDGSIVWAPDRGHWRNAPDGIAGTFLPAGELARERMAELRRVTGGDTVLRFPGMPPVRGVGPVITEQRA